MGVAEIKKDGVGVGVVGKLKQAWNKRRTENLESKTNKVI